MLTYGQKTSQDVSYMTLKTLAPVGSGTGLVYATYWKWGKMQLLPSHFQRSFLIDCFTCQNDRFRPHDSTGSATQYFLMNMSMTLPT